MERLSNVLYRTPGRRPSGARRPGASAWMVLPILALGAGLGCSKLANGSNVTPTITGISPAYADLTQVSANNPMTVTVTGSGFYNGGTIPAVTLVTIGGVQVPHGDAYPGNVVVSDSELTFDLDTLPVTGTGAPTLTTTGPVAVTTPGGTVNSAMNFDVQPAISAISPASGTHGATLTLSGNGLEGVTGVTFTITGTGAETVDGTITAQTATQLTVTVPQMDATSNTQVTVTLQNNYGIPQANSNQFTYIVS